jgi:hypothetical protein
LNGLLLAKEGISTTKLQFFICKTWYVSLKNNKIPKYALTNGLWIGITPLILPKLIMVEETLLTCYWYRTILVKSRYTNKGGTTCQHAIKVLDTLPSSLESC